MFHVKQYSYPQLFLVKHSRRPWGYFGVVFKDFRPILPCFYLFLIVSRYGLVKIFSFNSKNQAFHRVNLPSSIVDKNQLFLTVYLIIRQSDFFDIQKPFSIYKVSF